MIAARFDTLAAMSGSLDTSGTGGGAAETLGGVSAAVAAVQLGEEHPAQVGQREEVPLTREPDESGQDPEGDGSDFEQEPEEQLREVPRKTAVPRGGRGARAQATVPSE